MAQGPIHSSKAFICECVSEAVHNWGPNFKFPSDKVNHVQAWTCSLRSHGQPPSASDYSHVIDVKVMRLDTANGHLAEIRHCKGQCISAMRSPREYQPYQATVIITKQNKQLYDWRSHSSIQPLSILLSM